MRCYLTKVWLTGIVIVLSGCAAVNPNNNVGMRTVDNVER